MKVKGSSMIMWNIAFKARTEMTKCCAKYNTIFRPTLIQYTCRVITSRISVCKILQKVVILIK